MKRLLFTIFTLALFLIPFLTIPKAEAAGSEPVNIYFFRGQGCPHCAEEEIFLEEMKEKYPNIAVYDYEVWYNKENRELFKKVADELQVKASGVPLTVIGDETFVGFSRESNASAIEKKIEYYSEFACTDSVASIVGVPAPHDLDNDGSCDSDTTKSDNLNERVKVPFVGEIDVKNFSLPLLTLVFGALDGFNPCAMWILLFLISLLISLPSKRRRWLLGGAFIVTSAVVYFLFMAAWLNLVLFIGIVLWVRILIGLLALYGGGFNLKKFFDKKTSGCEVVDEKKRVTLFDRAKKVVNQKTILWALGGIILLAFSVNLIELLCSAGLPAVYTQVLAMNDLSTWQYYGYLLLYIFVFMLDDLIVFTIAMLTLQMTGVTTKYQKWSHLIGGILMLTIGLLLIFKPEWLNFS